MGCSTALPLTDIVNEVNQHLERNYVDKDDPRITQGVFTEPTIRGGLVLDEAAKTNFCEIVQECGLQAPFGEQWVNRPLYPDKVLVSEDMGEGDIQAVWREASTPRVYTTATLPTSGVAVGTPAFNTTTGKPIWWSGATWVDATGATV